MIVVESSALPNPPPINSFKKAIQDMGLRLISFPSLLLCLLLPLPALSGPYYTYGSTPSRAAYYGSNDSLGTPRGACGYGEFGREVYGGNVAAVSNLFQDGIGCGACYQVTCTDPKLCTEDGVEIMVTDHGASDNTDFILSIHAFAGMASQNKSQELIAFGVVDIEYERIPCKFPGYYVMVKVHENSRFPDYLVIIFIYQAAEKDILAVDLWKKDCKEWVSMRRAYGGVWDMPMPPKSPLSLRLLTSENIGKKKWVYLKNVIPEMWKP
ncbi:hypothetical protein ACLOJK_030451 [Asimina triloba]